MSFNSKVTDKLRKGKHNEEANGTSEKLLKTVNKKRNIIIKTSSNTKCSKLTKHQKTNKTKTSRRKQRRRRSIKTNRKRNKHLCKK